MRIGTVFPSNEIGHDTGGCARWARTVESLGYAHIELFDHVVGKTSDYAGRLWREPFVFLGYLAALTERVELVTGIIIAPQRQTALLAKQAAEVDLCSGGRLRLGLGVGWNPFEFDALDQDFTRRGRRMDGQIEAMRTLWSAQVVDVEVGDERISGGGLLPLPGREIPIWVGGRSDAAMRRAVTTSRGWLANFQDHLAADREDFVSARDALVAHAGGSLPDGFGIEAWTSPHRTDPATWADEAAEWAELGVTHLSLRTDENRREAQGPVKSVDEHLDVLHRYRDALGDAGIDLL